MKIEPHWISPAELKLGDVVRVNGNHDAFRDATVKQIKDGEVTLFRPYVHTADFSYTGGVICYLGYEEFQISVTSAQIEVVRRNRGVK